MNKSAFFKQFITINLIVGVLIVCSYFIPYLHPFFFFTVALYAFFVIFVYAAYHLGYKNAIDKDKNAFTRLVLMFIFFKMMICIMGIVVYVKLFEPASKGFLIPFLFLYVIYSYFEFNIFTKLSHLKEKE